MTHEVEPSSRVIWMRSVHVCEGAQLNRLAPPCQVGRKVWFCFAEPGTVVPTPGRALACASAHSHVPGGVDDYELVRRIGHADAIVVPGVADGGRTKHLALHLERNVAAVTQNVDGRKADCRKPRRCATVPYRSARQERAGRSDEVERSTHEYERLVIGFADRSVDG